MCALKLTHGHLQSEWMNFLDIKQVNVQCTCIFQVVIELDQTDSAGSSTDLGKFGFYRICSYQWNLFNVHVAIVVQLLDYCKGNDQTTSNQQVWQGTTTCLANSTCMSYPCINTFFKLILTAFLPKTIFFRQLGGNQQYGIKRKIVIIYKNVTLTVYSCLELLWTGCMQDTWPWLLLFLPLSKLVKLMAEGTFILGIT